MSLFWKFHLCLIFPSCLWCIVFACSTVLESASQCSRCTESVTGFVLPRADVEARQENGVVMVPAFSASQGGLPVAEAVQCMISMVVDYQTILGTNCGRKWDTGAYLTAYPHKCLFVMQKVPKFNTVFWAASCPARWSGLRKDCAEIVYILQYIYTDILYVHCQDC